MLAPLEMASTPSSRASYRSVMRHLTHIPLERSQGAELESLYGIGLLVHHRCSFIQGIALAEAQRQHMLLLGGEKCVSRLEPPALLAAVEFICRPGLLIDHIFGQRVCGTPVRTAHMICNDV